MPPQTVPSASATCQKGAGGGGRVATPQLGGGGRGKGAPIRSLGVPAANLAIRGEIHGRQREREFFTFATLQKTTA